MYRKRAWSRPRVYSIYPQKRRRYGWLSFGILPALIAGAWVLVPSRVAVDGNLKTAPANAQSVAVTKAQSSTAPTLAEAAVMSQAPLAEAQYAQLQPVIERWVQKQPKSQTWSVVVQDVSSDTNRVAVNDRASYYMASLYKLFLTLPLSQKYPFAAWQTTPIVTTDGTKSLKTCVDLMISRSDNPCGEGVGQTVGWLSATKAARSRAMLDTSLSSSDLRTSAQDVTTYLLGLERGKWFDAQSRQFILDSLAHQQIRAGIPAGCAGCLVWNKTGDLNGVKHDAAIVRAGNATFVLVIMSNGGSNAQIADVTRLVTQSLR